MKPTGKVLIFCLIVILIMPQTANAISGVQSVSTPSYVGGDIAPPALLNSRVDEDIKNHKLNFTFQASDRSGIKFAKVIWTYHEKEGEATGTATKQINEDTSEYLAVIDLLKILKTGESGELSYYIYLMDRAGNERRGQATMLSVSGPRPSARDLEKEAEEKGYASSPGVDTKASGKPPSGGKASEKQIKGFFDNFFGSLAETFKGIAEAISNFFKTIASAFSGEEVVTDETTSTK